jgi:hypothetical protein
MRLVAASGPGAIALQHLANYERLEKASAFVQEKTRSNAEIGQNDTVFN